ncbi:MAG: hypothetical protein WKF74_10855 [Pyrinomonadaceae bacterium]
MKLILVAVIVSALALFGGVTARSSSQRNLVGNIKAKMFKDTSLGDAGCSFQFAPGNRNSERYIFFSPAGFENDALMNIDGRDVSLRLVNETNPKGRERVGSRSTRRYAAGNITVNVVYVATRVCKPNDENCESTSYSATFIVKKGERTQTVKAAGSCGS